MSIGNVGEHHLQGFFLLLGCQVKLFLEELNGCLTQAVLYRWEVCDIVHTDIGVVVPILVIVFIGVDTYKTGAMQHVVFRIILNHGTHIVEVIAIPFVFQSLACCIGSAENAHGF